MQKLFLNLFFLFVFLAPAGLLAQQNMQQLIDDDMQFAASQYKTMMQLTPATRMPRSFDAAKNELITSDTKWWCSGFYPGTLWLIYGGTKDAAIRQEAEKRLALLEPEKNFAPNHDVGFKMFCSFGTAYALTKNPAYKDVVFTSAKTLTSRYRPAIKSIQSWDSSKNFNCPVIIDNMMNLELLEWVAKNGGDQQYDQIAVNHANTTLQNHYRPDFSSYHVVDYDLASGKVARKKTHQGFADESAWSRGQAWGLYGFVVMYRFTKDDRYLQQARNIAKFMLQHPAMPADYIPYWDFNAPATPTPLRDASAGAVLASALLELAQYSKGSQKSEYIKVAGKIITTLSSPAYRAPLGSNGGFLLQHCVGSLPHNSEVDVPLTYADYYFMEALTRYRDWVLKK
ncbi:MAG TPA: glycoside hydrolase family 88 protein [Chitinophagaceae bacterium]|nr:glycoside hydrolase family 88 protein [Chitinophagaceae bacterium]